MTQEEKELLLKDLSARVPYGVQILADINKEFDGGVISTLKTINLKKDWVELQSVLSPFKFDEIKPYLRSMDDMTEEEEFKLNETRCYTQLTLESYDWLNAHHFDYRGLIPKGLAIKITKENNPYD